MDPSGEKPKNLLEARWQSAPEVPLAFGHPENLITPVLEERWLKDFERFSRYYPNDETVKQFMFQGSLDIQRLRQRYHTELRFLSKTDTLKGLKEFAAEISGTFSPEKALFYFPSESYSYNLLYQTLLALKPDLAQFGTTNDARRGLILSKKNRFAGKSLSQAQAYIYVEDWILSAEHLSSFLTKDVAGKFHTFHLAVSDAGLNFLQVASKHLNPRFKYKVKTGNPKAFYAEVPLYGFHKIPDRIPTYYAPKHHDLYSIFGRNAEGDFILSNDRLVDHNKPLTARLK